VSRTPAIWTTALAVVLINIGVAALIVEAIGIKSFAPLWVELAILLAGVLAAVGAVRLWRQYLEQARQS
jgi:hypothetical protein